MRVVLFQPWVQRFEGGIGHCVGGVYVWYKDKTDAVVSVHEMYFIACVMRFISCTDTTASVHEMYFIACVMRFRQGKTRHAVVTSDLIAMTITSAMTRLKIRRTLRIA